MKMISDQLNVFTRSDENYEDKKNDNEILIFGMP